MLTTHKRDSAKLFVAAAKAQGPAAAGVVAAAPQASCHRRATHRSRRVRRVRRLQPSDDRASLLFIVTFCTVIKQTPCHRRAASALHYCIGSGVDKKIH